MELWKDEEIKNKNDEDSRKNQVEKYNNISQLVQKNTKKFSDKPFLGIKIGNSFKWLTYKKVRHVIEKLQNYFKIDARSELFTTMKFKNKVFPMIGIFTTPRPENFIFMLSLNLLRITILPIFNTIQDTNLTNILIHSEVKTLIIDCDGLSILINKNVFEKFSLPFLKFFILIDLKHNGLTELFKDEANDYESLAEKFDLNSAKLYFRKKGIEIILLSEILNRDADNILENNFFENNQDDIILLNYTSSNSTFQDTKQASVKISSPKGVLTSEISFISTLNSLLEHKNYNLNKGDTYFSLTSTADIPEYLHNLVAMSNGIKIGYYSGQPGQIFDDLKTLQPSILYLYPRVLNKICEALRSTINKLNDTKKNIVNSAIKIKINCLLEHGVVDHHIWDKLFFKKMKDTVGGNIRLIVVGGHLSLDDFRFLKVCLNTNITEIYGVTESSGIISISDFDSKGNKFIGSCINSVKIYLKKNRKLGLFQPDCHNDNLHPSQCGEICVKGNLFSGYYKSKSIEDATDNEGYFNTEDFGVLYEDSIPLFEEGHRHIRLIDKSNEIMTTSAGFFISPNILEEIYSRSDYVSNIAIIQDKEFNLIAMIVVNEDKILSMLKGKNLVDEAEDVTCDKRKGSMNSNHSDKSGNSLQYKPDKSRSKCSKSIYVKNTNPKFLGGSCDNLKTPTRSNSMLSQAKEESYIENRFDNEKLKKEILNSFRMIWAENKLKNYEFVNQVFILENFFHPCVDNGLLTCKMKLNRESLQLVYLNNSS